MVLKELIAAAPRKKVNATIIPVITNFLRRLYRGWNQTSGRANGPNVKQEKITKEFLKHQGTVSFFGGFIRNSPQ